MEARDVEAICVSYVNKLIDGLQLGIPYLRFIQQIDVAHLVEMHCRLVGLNFSEYTANPERPSKDIEDIILSLQDRYGANNFHHLNATLISQKNPKHMLCLLQIFNEIYEYYERKGHSFTTPRHHDSTLLASSHHNTTAGDSSVTETEQSDTEGSTSANMTDTSSGTFEEHKFNIPFSDSELDNDAELWQSFDHSSTRDESGAPPPAATTSNEYLAENEESYQKGKAERINLAVTQKRPPFTELMKSQSKAPKTSGLLKPRTQPVTSNPSAPNWDQIKSIRGQPSTKPSKKKIPRSSSVNPSSRTIPPKGRQSQSKLVSNTGALGVKRSQPIEDFQNLPGPSRAVGPNRGGRTASSKREKPKRNPSAAERLFKGPPISVTSRNESFKVHESGSQVGGRPPVPTTRLIDHDENYGNRQVDPLLQLNDIHDEIQTHIRNQLSKMEQEISSLRQGSPSQGQGHKKQCCDDSVGSQKTKDAQPQRYDYFGNPIKERFPLYTRGIIKPICHSSYPQRKGMSKPSWQNLNAIQEGDENSYGEDGEGKTRRSKVDTKLSSTLCSKILKQVAQEMPECHFDDETLRILKKKCKAHVKTVARVEFDEESIRNMVMDKLKIFVQGNQSTISLQKKLDDADKRRNDQLADQKLSKMFDNRKRAEKSAKHGVKKQHQHARKEIQKLVLAKKVESRQIMEAFEEALQHEKKSALSLRKDKRERANMVAAEADVLLKNLQDFNTRELNNLKEEYAALSKEMGPNADQKFQEIKDAYRLNIQREINRCVDKIIQNIASIYKDI